MRELHSLLKRQLKRYSGQTDQRFVGETDLLHAINDAYWQFDADRKMLEHSMELTSQELLETNSELQKANQDLEQNVVERTANLNGVNEQLHMELAERKRVEDVLRESEARYHGLFEESPISLWQEDFSEVKIRLDELRGQGVTDFRAYLEKHPQVVAECARLVKITDVNHVTLKLLGAESKPELLQNLDRIFDAESYEGFREELAQIADGHTQFQREGVNQTLAGKRVDVLLQWSVVSGYEDTLSQVIISLQDITERKQAEDALHEAETKYRTLVEQLPAVTYLDLVDDSIKSGEFTTKYVSPQVESLLGYTPGEFYTDPSLWAQLIHPDDRERILARNAEHFRTHGFYGEEYRMLTRKGHEIWVRDEAVVVRGENHEQALSQGVVFDITEQKKADDALRLSESKYRMLAENSLQGIAIYQDQRMVYANPALCKINGYSAEELLAMSADQIIAIAHPDNQDIAQQRAKKRMAGETVSSDIEMRIIRKDGSMAWLQAYNNPIMYAGRPALLSTVLDITGRKQAEEALRKSETILSQAGEIAHLGAWEIEISNAEDLNSNPLRWSDETYRIFGYEPGEVPSSNALFFERVHPEDRQKIVDIVSRAIAEKKSYEIEHRIIRPDGSEWIVFEHADITYNEKGQPLRMLGAIQDITERKQAEHAMRESDTRYRDLFENSPISLWEEDFSLVKQRLDTLRQNGITDFREYFSAHPDSVAELASLVKVTDANKASLELFGAKRKEDLLKNLADILDGETLKHFQDEILG